MQMKHHPDIIDLSWSISVSTPTYPTDPILTIKEPSDNLSGFYLRELSTAMHVGTHMDSQRHINQDGWDISQIPLSQTIGLASTIVINPVNGIILTKDIDEAYHQLFQKHPKLLIHTGYSSKRFDSDYFEQVYSFEPSILDFLLHNQIELLGLDMPTFVYVGNNAAQAHHDLLDNRILIIENLIHLDRLEPECFFMSQPLKLDGFDGSMIRAVAINQWKMFY